MISRVMRRNICVRYDICVKKLSTHRTHSGRVGIQLGLLGDDSVALKPKEKKTTIKIGINLEKYRLKKQRKKKKERKKKLRNHRGRDGDALKRKIAGPVFLETN